MANIEAQIKHKKKKKYEEDGKVESIRELNL
jgi:hypothetical protein